MSNDDKSLDVFGVKPIADSVNKVTDGTVNGVSAFLSRICLPAAEEFGLLLKDKVSSWRAKNAAEIANKAQALLGEQVNETILHGHPRIIYAAIENGSWVEDEFMQKLWAGLLASSCTETGKDESNLIFVNILSQLTTNQALLVSHICQNCKTYQTQAGWIASEPFHMELEELVKVMKTNDIYQIDRELDHLRGMELISTGFTPEHTKADVTPHALCLNLYIRGQGYVGNPSNYFDSPVLSKSEIDKVQFSQTY